MSERVTLNQLARIAGVAKSTVSYALRNDQRISRETRERIQALAVELGYRANPVVSHLMAQLNTLKREEYQGTIAYLTDSPERGGWRQIPEFMRYWQGAAHRAWALGYKLEEFWLREPGMTSKRLSGILYNRGIRGVIVGPLTQAGTELNLEWDRFSSVAVGYTLAAPNLHRVTHHHAHGMGLALRTLTERGYERIGMAMYSRMNARADHGWLYAYLKHEMERTGGLAIPPLFMDDTQPDEARARVLGPWLKQHGVQAVVSANSSVAERLLPLLGYQVPEDMGYAYLACVTGSDFGEQPPFAGIDQHGLQIGVAAADIVTGQIYRNENGVPDFPKLTLMEGFWTSGKTAPGPAAAAPPEGTGLRRKIAKRQLAEAI